MAHRAVAYPPRSDELFVFRAWFVPRGRRRQDRRQDRQQDRDAAELELWAYLACAQSSELRGAAVSHLRRAQPVYTRDGSSWAGDVRRLRLAHGELIHQPPASAATMALERRGSLKKLQPPREWCDPDFIGEDDIRRPKPEVLDWLFQGQRFEDDPRAVSRREPVFVPARRPRGYGGGSLALGDFV